MNFIVQIAVALVLMVAAYLLTPKPKSSPQSQNDMDDPKASAGSPIKVVFGTVTIKDPNILWYGDKSTRTFKTKA